MNKYLLSFVLGGALLLSPVAVRAQAPGSIGSIISYQGQLSNANGAPIADGTTSLTFKIYEAGTEKSSQTMSVATVGGVFNTFLSVGALTFDPTKSYELGITFNGSETRHPIAAVPVALNAATAANVSGVVPIANGGTGSATQPFVDLTTEQTVAGAKTFANTVTVPQVNIGANRVLGTNPDGSSVFVGPSAGSANGTVGFNVFVGGAAGRNSTGESNVFVGADAGASNTSGANNTAIGDLAGNAWTTGNFNIAIGNQGVADESQTIRIGSRSQNRAFIGGIRNATGLAGALPVVISASGQLGTGSGTTDATTLSGVVPIANGGTGSATQPFVDLTTEQTIAGAKTFSDALRGNSSLLLNGTSGFAPISGAGTRMMWVPEFSAFRAGRVVGTEWDNINIGRYSVAMGDSATASGSSSVAIGTNVTADNSNSMVLGRFASANGKIGSFVYGDGSSNQILKADANFQAVWRTAGGFKIFTSSNTDPTQTSTPGVEIGARSGSWSTMSDRNSKDRFGPIDAREVLRKVSALPLSSWQYKGNPSRHIGPMAQDFRTAFGLGLDEKHIDTVDADGVALAAIQGLNSELRDRDAKIAALQAQNAAFEARLKKLEAKN